MDGWMAMMNPCCLAGWQRRILAVWLDGNDESLLFGSQYRSESANHRQTSVYRNVPRLAFIEQNVGTIQQRCFPVAVKHTDTLLMSDTAGDEILL
jgi:hypothetical protein